MVTDQETTPIEFVVSDPATTTIFQRILGGVAARKRLLVDTVGVALLNGLKNKPGVIFVDDVVMMGLGKHTDIPLANWGNDTDAAETADRPDDWLLESIDDPDEVLDRVREAIDEVNENTDDYVS